MASYRKKIEILLKELESSNILNYIYKMSRQPDDFQMTSYGIHLNDSKTFSDGFPFFGLATGFSYSSSKDFALFKGLVEAIERYSNGCYREKDLVYSDYNDLTKEAIDPFLFTHNESIRKIKLGWVKGFNLMTKKTCLIPAQVLYLTYRGVKTEPFLTTTISTGCAGGIEHYSTLLRGIYEIVERDAFMCAYLLRIKAKRVDPLSVNNKKMRQILSDIKRYNFELYLFDISNDLQISTFLSIIIDRSGLGPAVSPGLKSSFDMQVAIFGSIEESINIRPWQARHIFQFNKTNFKPRKIDSFDKRAKLWIPVKMIKHINFLINQDPVKIKIKSYNKTVQEELKDVLNIFKNNKINVYYADITLPNFKKLGYLIYNAVIPQLQPLYASEVQKEINIERLKKVADYFGVKEININPIPHPFL